jgi:hypothetical protein
MEQIVKTDTVVMINTNRQLCQRFKTGKEHCLVIKKKKALGK